MSKINIAWAAIGIVIVCLVMAMTSGCGESQQAPVWGKGELPADYVSFFGDDNNARLDRAQSDMLNRHQVVIHGIERTKDGETERIPGLIDAIVQLDARLKVLEAVDPNS